MALGKSVRTPGYLGVACALELGGDHARVPKDERIVAFFASRTAPRRVAEMEIEELLYANATYPLGERLDTVRAGVEVTVKARSASDGRRK